MNPRVFDAIQGYAARVDQMPLAYQNIPGGRPLHNDWAVFKDTPRISTAYRVPLPFRMDSGVNEKQWMLWDTNYPASPGLEIRVLPYTTSWGTLQLPHALVDCAKEGSGGASFSAYINGQWMPVFTSYRKVILGRLLAQYSGGLKQDLTVTPQPDGTLKSDVMGWWDPPSLSYNAVS